MMNDRPTIGLHDRVRLTPGGPLGTVQGFPRKTAGEPPLAVVAWETGKTNIHDRRNLILVEKATR